MAIAAERRLPALVASVMRCAGCTRALWYRSYAMDEIAELQVAIRNIKGAAIAELQAIQPLGVRQTLRQPTTEAAVAERKRQKLVRARYFDIEHPQP